MLICVIISRGDSHFKHTLTFARKIGHCKVHLNMLNLSFQITVKDAVIDLLFLPYQLPAHNLKERKIVIKVLVVRLSSELALRLFHV